MGTPSDPRLAAAIGPNARYYLDLWARDDESFCWPACLAAPFWLPYRRMRRRTAQAFLVFALAETVTEIVETLGVKALGLEATFLAALGQRQPNLFWLVLVGWAVYCGKWGNVWYREHVLGTVGRAASPASPASAATDAFAAPSAPPRRGGTSAMGGVLGVVVWALVVALTFAGLTAGHVALSLAGF